jgi:thymidylate synthase ThyX
MNTTYFDYVKNKAKAFLPEEAIVNSAINNYAVDILACTENITTYKLRYPRFIHSEVMTHRIFSRNASSSRAIPVKKEIAAIQSNMATPLVFSKDTSGMHSLEYIVNEKTASVPIDYKDYAEDEWRKAAMSAGIYATNFGLLGIHKQHTNRLLEPFQLIDVVLTGHDFTNFFDLRTHYTAQPEIRLLSTLMESIYNIREPSTKDYHLPFITEEDMIERSLFDNVITSVARCARVSYRREGKAFPDHNNDVALFFKLLEYKHMSPFEHVLFRNVYGYEDPYQLRGDFVSLRYLYEKGANVLKLTEAIEGNI